MKQRADSWKIEKNEIDLRLTIDPNREDYTAKTFEDIEELIVHTIVRDVPFVTSVVIRRNDGFARLLPDETTRQEQ